METSMHFNFKVIQYRQMCAIIKEKKSDPCWWPAYNIEEIEYYRDRLWIAMYNNIPKEHFDELHTILHQSKIDHPKS